MGRTLHNYAFWVNCSLGHAHREIRKLFSHLVSSLWGNSLTSKLSLATYSVGQSVPPLEMSHYLSRVQIWQVLHRLHVWIEDIFKRDSEISLFWTNIQASSSFKEFNNIFKTMLKNNSIWLSMNRNRSKSLPSPQWVLANERQSRAGLLLCVLCL